MPLLIVTPVVPLAIFALESEIEPPDFVPERLSLLDSVDFGANCAFIIAQKYNPLPKDKDELSKMMASLMRYGYSINDIKAGIRIFAEGEKNGN